MLHILLLILKIIGIILLVILGILVLLVCIVLFVPVRYEVNGKCEGTLKTVKAKAKVTWFFHLVRADVYYKENKMKWRIRIAWKKIGGGQSIERDGKKDEQKAKENEKAAEDAENAKSLEKATEESGENAKGFEKIAEESGENAKGFEEVKERPEEIEKGCEKVTEIPKSSEETEKEYEAYTDEWEKVWESVEKPDFETEKSKEESAGEHTDENAKDGGKLEKIIEKIKGIYNRIKCTIKKICDKIKELSEKKDKLLGFIRDETHVNALQKLKKEVFKLLKRLRPKNILIKARFGFEDPARTGQVLAVLSALYPFTGDSVAVLPDFENKILKGTLYAKGRIYICCFAALAWNLFWNKNIRRTYKDVKNFEL